jgi:hypothetical protein
MGCAGTTTRERFRSLWTLQGRCVRALSSDAPMASGGASGAAAVYVLESGGSMRHALKAMGQVR